MGSPLSPIIADLVIQDLEKEAISRLPFNLPIYFRYVDDILIAAPIDKIEFILNVFNSLHERLQFSLEINTNNHINFLNLMIHIENNKFLFDIYYKPTFSGRYLSFYSNHPLIHKRGVIFSLIDKVLLLSNPIFQQKNLNIIIENLLNNGYPLNFIFKNINNRIKVLDLIKKKHNSNKSNNSGYCSIPYINKLSHKFKHIFSNINTNLAFSCNHKLNKLIKTGKDQLNKLQHTNVVYRIQCSNCDATYVGQTKRQLKTRIKKHRQDIQKKSGNFSVVTEHKIDYNHEFDWDNIEILDTERFYNKRLISENLHIKRQINSINKQTDTIFFPDLYLPILNKFPT